jgi:uncharacterized membrane protein
MPKQQIIKQEVNASRTQIAASYHHGPLPSPETFAHYEQVCPGAAERILIMAEKQAGHRQNMEMIITKSNSRDSSLGIIFAFLIGTITIITGAIVVIKGQPFPGTFLGTAGLASLVGAFIYGTRQNRQVEEKPKISKRTK